MGQACVRKGVEVKLMNTDELKAIHELEALNDDISFQEAGKI